MEKDHQDDPRVRISLPAFPFATIIAVVACLGCGYMFLFIYERELFLSVDKFSLSSLAIAITFPPLIANTVSCLPKVGAPSVGDVIYHRLLSVYLFSGSVALCGVYGLIVLIGYFLEISTKGGVITFLILEILFVLLQRWAMKD